MSVEVTDWIWKHSTASGNDLIVLLKIGDNANADGGGAYPGIVYLSKAGRISKRAVYDCLRRLKGSGELAEEEHGGGRGRKTTYRVLMGKGAESASYPEGNGAARRTETVQPAARNGADSGSASIRNRTVLNRPKNHAPPPAADEQEQPENPEPRQDVDRLCLLLADRIITNGGNPEKYRAKAKTKAWRDPMRLLLDRDGVEPERVGKAIEWCQADDFWRGVILSPANLREKFDQLRLAAQRNGHGQAPLNLAERSERDRQLAATQAKLANSPWARKYNGGQTA